MPSSSQAVFPVCLERAVSDFDDAHELDTVRPLVNRWQLPANVGTVWQSPPFIRRAAAHLKERWGSEWMCVGCRADGSRECTEAVSARNEGKPQREK